MPAHEPWMPPDRARGAAASSRSPPNIGAAALSARVRAPSIVLSHAFALMGSPSHVRMPSRSPGGQLLGRQREREVLGRLLNAVLGGDGGVLVVHGEPGVGKTALLEWTVEEGRQFRVLRAVGV